MNYYERHLGDYARDAGHLSMLEHGAYTLLMDRYYLKEQPIPEAMVYRLCRATTDEERAAVDVVLEEFFTLEDGAYRNNRADEEVAKAQARIEAARENGKRGGRPKKPKQNPPETQSVNSASDQQTQQKAHQTPDTSITTANAVGADAPPDPIFGSGLKFLRRKGVPEKPARAFLGKLRKNLRDDVRVASLLARCEEDDVTEPIPWLSKAVTNATNGSPSKTMSAIQRLEGLKDEVAENGNRDGYAETPLLASERMPV